MTWAIFYLVCFLVGVTLSVSVVPGRDVGICRIVHLHVPHAHVPARRSRRARRTRAAGSDMPFFNFATITAFLAWFGGTGYLLTRYSTLVVTLVLMVSIALGLVGASIVFVFIAKVLLAHSRELDPADYERVGVLGRVISPIRAGGTGEIIFSQEGTRHTCGARSENGEALARETEVIITRYEKGIAYVRRFDEMAEKAVTSS